MTDKEIYILNNIEKLIFKGEISNDFMVNNCKLIEEYLNPVKVSVFAKKTGKSRQYLYRKAIYIFGYKYIINNE